MKAVMAQGMLNPSKTTGRFSPPSQLWGKWASSAKLPEGWAEGHIMFPFHRNPELFQEVSNGTEIALSFLIATPWDII